MYSVVLMSKQPYDSKLVVYDYVRTNIKGKMIFINQIFNSKRELMLCIISHEQKLHNSDYSSVIPQIVIIVIPEPQTCL